VSKEGIESAASTLAERVAPIYKLLRWRWTTRAGKSVPGYVPTKEDIRGALLELYEQISSEEFVEGASDSLSTGGLQVYRYRDEECCAHYMFRFRVEEDLDWHNQVALRKGKEKKKR